MLERKALEVIRKLILAFVMVATMGRSPIWIGTMN